MDEGTLVTRRESLIEAEIEGELMALSVDRGLCFGFNATAAELWRLIETPHTLATLCDSMMARHVVDRATCRADIADALTELATRELVTLTPPR